MKSHFNFNKQQRSGIFYLLLLLIVLQFSYLGLKYHPFKSNDNLFKLDVKNQKSYDSLVMVSNSSKSTSKKMFNPNYISDFKGYSLGMSPLEIDRLHQFRVQDKFVNSADEFQKVTGISDSLLNSISPYFKFPEWVSQKRDSGQKNITKYSSSMGSDLRPNKEIKDLNTASAEELKQISGIGEKLSARIIKFRDRLGGFLVNEQLYDVYGLESQVVKKALQRFQVLNPPSIEKININTADIDELASLIYLRYNVAENIVIYRQEKGQFTSLDDLFNVPEFPVNKIDRIGLYLSY